MIIVGSKGFAKEILEIFHQKHETNNLFFFDDLNSDLPEKLFGKYPIFRSEEDVLKHFNSYDKDFTIGIGNPKLRKFIYEKFVSLSGKFTSCISKYAEIGSYEVEIEEGCNILSGVKISNSVKIGKGCLIYYNSVITHDVQIGSFVEISPNVSLLGRCKIGDNVHIATGAIVYPDVIIGNNSIIAAGSIVRNNVPDNVMYAGAPAQFKKNLNE